MKLKKRLLFALLVILGSTVVAQNKKANKLYNDYYYSKAIPLYLKKAKKDNKEAIEKLANCYRLTNNYQESERYYAKLFKQQDVAAVNHLYYGEALKNNNKLEEAKQQFTLYSKEATSDKRTEAFIMSCVMTKVWSQKPEEYDVSNVGELNTKNADFCPVPYKDGIAFVSEREKDLLNNSTYGWTDKPYLAIFYSESKTKKNNTYFEDGRSFPSRVNTEYHNGPATFSADYKEMFFTRVDKSAKSKEKGQEVVYRPKIYSASSFGGTTSGWKDVTLLSFNSDDYSCAHPALSTDGKLLFFTSDMPGGYGGKDLYVCKREGSTWTKPENLGSEVNTDADECYPFYSSTGTLYFSSNGHIGIGGLDIFSARNIDNTWTSVTNLQAPINSSTDDFGIMFTDDDKKGYFSSNRSAGKGSDDIYRLKSKIADIKITAISGRIMKNELDPANNFNVKLLNQKGDVIQEGKTSNTGDFGFEKLSTDQSYVILLDADETGLNTKAKASKVYGKLYYNEGQPGVNARIIVRTKQGLVMREVVADEKGFFKFEKLSTDFNTLNLMEEENASLNVKKNVVIVGKVMIGDELNQAGEGVEVVLNDQQGNVIGKTKVGADGFFRFEKLATDNNYIVIIDETDAKISTSKKHAVLGKVLVNGMPDDPTANVSVTLGGEKGAVLKSTKTDADGFFRFESLSTDYNKLSLIDEGNTSLNVSIKEGQAAENIYYDFGKWDIKPEGAVQLDKVVAILKSNPNIAIELFSHTDARDSDDKNLVLSQKRAKTAIDYIVSKGGDPIRIVGTGMGETKILNRCKNGVTCSEDEHKQNRRTEIKITKLQIK